MQMTTREETARCPDDSISLCCDDLLHVILVLSTI